MSSTVGQLIDTLSIVQLKMWWAQEHVYEIRKMTLEEFKEKYWSTPEGAEKIYQYLQKACDLNLQRNQIINEIDETLIKIVQSAINGESLDDGKYIRNQHKTY